jgi:hypothetical protein
MISIMHVGANASVDDRIRLLIPSIKEIRKIEGIAGVSIGVISAGRTFISAQAFRLMCP